VINIINGCAKAQNVEREAVARKSATIDPLFSACSSRARLDFFFLFFFFFGNRARDGLVGLD